MPNHDQTPILVPQFSSPVTVSPAPPAGIDQGVTLGDYASGLWRRKWWIIGTFLAIFSAAAFYTFTKTPIFQAIATFQITQDNPGSQVSANDKTSVLIGGNDALEKFQQTQLEILKSRSLALRIIKALNLREHPDFKPDPEKTKDKSETEIENMMVARFLDKLEIKPVKNSYLVEASFQSPDKALAQKVVNSIADEYMYLSIDRRNESFNLVRRWLDKQLGDLSVKVQEAQKKLYRFGQKSDIYTLEDKDNVIVQRFIDLSGLLTKAQADKMSKEAQYQQIKDRGPDAPLIVNNPLVAQLRQQLVTQQAKVAALKQVYRSGNPEMQTEQANLAALQGRLGAEVQRLRQSIKADYEAADRAEKLLMTSFAAQKEQMVKLQDNLSEFQILKRDAQTNEQLYQALLARVKEASIASTMVPTNVAVIDPGQLPSKPFKPKTVRDLALATILGLLLSVSLGLLMETLDDSIKSTDDLERASNLPSLGTVPVLGNNRKFALSRRKNPDLIIYKHPQDPATEALRHMQTSVMLAMNGRLSTAIMIASPNPAEGNTVIASNLAQSFALHGRPTVIIDGDLRRPRLHQIFEIGEQPGLTDYLTGTAAPEDVLRPTSVPNLRVITAGPRSPDPGKLLNSENFTDLLTRLRGEFRHIIIDTPPLLGFADARLIAVQMDGVLLVTKHHATKKSAAHMAQQLLSQINVPLLGTVLNFDTTGKGFGGCHNHNYKYYSRYYDEVKKG